MDELSFLSKLINFFVIGVNVSNERFDSSFFFVVARELAKEVGGHLLVGVVGSGVGEALVTDEDIGTFADIVKGTKLEPFAITMLDREDKQGREDALRRLKNRLKFGTEGALFNLALVGAGKGIQKLRGVDVEPLDEFAKTAIGRDMQRFGPEYGFRPENFLGKSTFEIKEFFFLLPI